MEVTSKQNAQVVPEGSGGSLNWLEVILEKGGDKKNGTERSFFENIENVVNKGDDEKSVASSSTAVTQK